MGKPKRHDIDWIGLLDPVGSPVPEIPTDSLPAPSPDPSPPPEPLELVLEGMHTAWGVLTLIESAPIAAAARSPFLDPIGFILTGGKAKMSSPYTQVMRYVMSKGIPKQVKWVRSAISWLDKVYHLQDIGLAGVWGALLQELEVIQQIPNFVGDVFGSAVDFAVDSTVGGIIDFGVDLINEWMASVSEPGHYVAADYSTKLGLQDYHQRLEDNPRLGTRIQEDLNLEWVEGTYADTTAGISDEGEIVYAHELTDKLV
jgi:hypothetical protein